MDQREPLIRRARRFRRKTARRAKRLRRRLSTPGGRKRLWRLARKRTKRQVKRLRRAVMLRFRHATGPLRAIPDFVILGAQKGGTTSLYRYLESHPEVFPAERKEINYFTHHYDQSFDRFYRRHFPLRVTMRLAARRRGHRTVTGEATPDYLFYPEVAERLRAALPDTKLIVLARDPLCRAFSHYRMQVRRGTETLDFADALRAEPARLNGTPATKREADMNIRPHRKFSYVARGRYAEQLERYLALYPREQILVIRSEEMFMYPDRVYTRVLEFLGLRTDVPHPDFVPHNRWDDGPPVPEKVARELEGFFHESNQRLGELTGIDFSKPPSGHAVARHDS